MKRTKVYKTKAFILVSEKNFINRFFKKDVFIGKNSFGSHLYERIEICNLTLGGNKSITIYFKDIVLFFENKKLEFKT